MSVVAAGIMAAGTVGAAAINSGAGGNGLTAQPPAPQQTAGSILGAQVSYAPQILNLSQQEDPQYAALQSQLMQQELFGGNGSQGLLSMYSQAAPQLQSLQTQLNTQQAGANIGLVGQYGSSAISTYQSANPQLQALQNQYFNMAMNPQSPISQVNAGSNPTVSMLNNTAQQQLALGTSVSPQQAATTSGQIMANYNAQGRANDPTAIAGLAQGLDTYGQQLLQQREGAAAGAGQLAAQQQSLGQNSQLQNAMYQSNLMSAGSNLAQATAINPYALVLGQSGALGNAMGSVTQAGGTAAAGQNLASMYNPFNTQLMNTLTNAGTTTSLANQNVNAGLFSGSMQGLGSLLGQSSGSLSSLAGLFGAM